MSKNAEHLKVQLEAIRSMFDEMGGIQKVLADLTIVHDWVKRLEQLRQQMHSFERCSQTAEQKYLDVQHIMKNRHEIRCELNQALHSSKEIQKDCQKLKDEVDAKHQTMVSKVNELVTAEWSKHEKETNERIEGLRALLSGDIVNVRTEISKAVFPVRNLAEESHACLQKQIRGLQKEIEVLKLATTPQKSRKSPTKRTRKISRKE
jgi:hypothetical protein